MSLINIPTSGSRSPFKNLPLPAVLRATYIACPLPHLPTYFVFLIPGLLAAGAMALWHGVEFYEKEKVVGEEFYQQWPNVSYSSPIYNSMARSPVVVTPPSNPVVRSNLVVDQWIFFIKKNYVRNTCSTLLGKYLEETEMS